VRGLLDGHIVLSRALGASGHYPAIDVLQSVSRLAGRVSSPDERDAANKIRAAMADYQRSEDLINLGAYVAGSNPALDTALRVRPQLLDFLKQPSHEEARIESTRARVRELAATL
jgi:flagellar biosynthesis/type III secretory pathway ATPase